MLIVLKADFIIFEVIMIYLSVPVNVNTAPICVMAETVEYQTFKLAVHVL
jgi:hypothetical protein